MISRKQIEDILYSSGVDRSQIEEISDKIVDLCKQDIINLLRSEVESFILHYREGKFSTREILLFKDYLSCKVPLSYKKIYVDNIEVFYTLLNAELGSLKLEIKGEDICVTFFSEETVLHLADIYENSILQKVDYKPLTMEMTIDLIIIDKNLIVWQDIEGNGVCKLNREFKMYGKILESESLLYLSVLEPDGVFENVYIPLIMKDDMTPISFIVRDSLENVRSSLANHIL